MAISVRKELTGGASLGQLRLNVDMPRLVLLPGADLAEHFAVVEVVDIDPGTVMVIFEGRRDTTRPGREGSRLALAQLPS